MDSGVPPGTYPPLPGDPAFIGRYPVLGRLGVGGMGVVFLGRDPGGGLVAVKALRPARAADAETRARFASEAGYGRRIRSPWTPRVIDDRTGDPEPYVVTEFLRGPSLSQWVLTQGPLNGDVLTAVAVGTAAALADIHAEGVVHRDLKPANVLLTPEGPRVIDFGIANDLEAPGGMTQQGMVIGSPGWVAPERLEGAEGGPAADVFSWGCVIAFAALGRHPFGHGQNTEILYGEPELAELDGPLRELILLSLAKTPGRRPAAADLVVRLRAGLGDGEVTDAVAALWDLPIAGGPDTVTEPVRRRPRPALLAAAAGVGAVAAIVGLTGTAMNTKAGADPSASPQTGRSGARPTATATGGRSALPPQGVSGRLRSPSPGTSRTPGSGVTRVTAKPPLTPVTPVAVSPTPSPSPTPTPEPSGKHRHRGKPGRTCAAHCQD